MRAIQRLVQLKHELDAKDYLGALRCACLGDAGFIPENELNGYACDGLSKPANACSGMKTKQWAAFLY